MWRLQKKRTYLDWAAAAPATAMALRAFRRGLVLAGNPSSTHTDGREARAALERARASIARLAGVKAGAVIFTSGATESNNLAIEGHVRARVQAGLARADMHVLYVPSSHASTLKTIDALRESGVQVEALSVRGGALDLRDLEQKVRAETVLVCVDAVCGETGAFYAVLDVRRVLARAEKTYESTIELQVDGSQLPLVGSILLTRLGASMLTLDAQKIGGVRGIGALIAPRHVPLRPLLYGGAQERGMRPGTESPALALAFAAALEEAQSGREEFLARAVRLRAILLSGITSLPEVYIQEGAQQAPHIVNLSLLGRDTDYLCALLDEAGYAVSTKSACETASLGSRAVLAFTGSPERARATLRVSFGSLTTEKEVRRCAHALVCATAFLDKGEAGV